MPHGPPLWEKAVLVSVQERSREGLDLPDLLCPGVSSSPVPTRSPPNTPQMACPEACRQTWRQRKTLRPPGEGEHILSFTAVCIPGHRWLLHKHVASACLYDSLPRGCGPAAQTASPVSCPGMAQALPTGPAACHTQSTCCQAQRSCRPALVVSGLTWQTEPAAQFSTATQLGTHIFPGRGVGFS